MLLLRQQQALQQPIAHCNDAVQHHPTDALPMLSVELGDIHDRPGDHHNDGTDHGPTDTQWLGVEALED